MHSNRARSTGNVVARIASTWMVVERLGGRHAARSHTDATCCTAACLSGYSISNALNHYNGGGREKEGERGRERDTRLAKQSVKVFEVSARRGRFRRGGGAEL